MTPPRRLVDWPLVQVEVECSLCPRHGRYRLARLAERYGAGGYGPSIYLFDPEGNMLEFKGPPASIG